LHSKPIKKTSDKETRLPALTDSRALAEEAYALSGSLILDRILELDEPQRAVQALPCEDFFFLIKKIGEDDCLPILEMASEDQWQYVLDLEIWRKDQLLLGETSAWLARLNQASPGRLARWFFNEGQDLGNYYFFKTLQIEIKDKDEAYDLPDEFFTLDGVFYIRILDKEHEDTIREIIRKMAYEDFERYQAFISNLTGILPAEAEEEMYRLRKVRLGEHGFLPFEEALSVYAPLEPESIRLDETSGPHGILVDESVRAIVPVLPLYQGGPRNMLAEIGSQNPDPLFLDRIRLEFAGLCNQLLSADGILVNELEVLMRTCHKASRYINLGLEKLCGEDLSLAEKLIKTHPILSVFRVGFGLALKLKWKAERWLPTSWAYNRGLDTTFWGEQWGQTLAGLLKTIPKLYTGFHDGGEYKDFESLSELAGCRRILENVKGVDWLLKSLSERYLPDEILFRFKELTFYPLLFNFWARKRLNLKLSLSGISLTQARRLLQQLRAGTDGPPYRMPGAEEAFVGDFLSYAGDLDSEASSLLRQALVGIWREFHDEYEWVSGEDLDARYSRFISIRS
jgi:hypothetical protein